MKVSRFSKSLRDPSRACVRGLKRVTHWLWRSRGRRPTDILRDDSLATLMLTLWRADPVYCVLIITVNPEKLAPAVLAHLHALSPLILSFSD